MDQDEYTDVLSWTEGHSTDAKLPCDYHTTQIRRHTLPAKPIPLPKPKVNRVSSTNSEPPITRRKKLPIPLPHNEEIKPLPSLPTEVQTELPEIDPLPEEPIQLPTVTSKPYDLETFYKTFEFPQIVSVVGGHLGVTEEYSISKDEELVLFFVKTSQMVVASSKRNSEWYFVPLNSSLQFVPCQYLSASDTSTKGEEYYQQYKTVADLLNRKGELPKVVKACKSYNGKSAQSSVVAGDLIFPQKVLVSFRRKKVLECLNSKNKLLKLELNCEGNFSINPADVKMYLAELVHYFKDFPISAMVINEHSKLSLTTGTVLSLEEPKPLQSYICSTDIFGKMNYPLMELPMSMPIEIQCIKYPDFDMKPVYTKIQHTYENFKPSMIKKNIFDAHSTSKLTTQQELYEEIQNDDCYAHVYDLEKPSLIYDSIPEKFLPTTNSLSIVNEVPPLPPPRTNSLGRPRVRKENSYFISNLLPAPPKPSTASEEVIRNNVTISSSGSNKKPIVKNQLILSRDDYPVTVKNPSHVSGCNPTLSTSGTKNFTFPRSASTSQMMDVASYVDCSKEENVAYLKTLSLFDMLQLLDNMNLGQYKGKFADEQIDGEIFVHLERTDLVDLGINTKIQQTRLLKLIDGSMSAKKYKSDSYVLLQRT